MDTNTNTIDEIQFPLSYQAGAVVDINKKVVLEIKSTPFAGGIALRTVKRMALGRFVAAAMNEKHEKNQNSLTTSQ